jgi:hypothetical protein
MTDSAVNPLVDLPNDLAGFLERYVYVIEGDQICSNSNYAPQARCLNSSKANPSIVVPPPSL